MHILCIIGYEYKSINTVSLLIKSKHCFDDTPIFIPIQRTCISNIGNIRAYDFDFVMQNSHVFVANARGWCCQWCCILHYH